ncbi:MAG: DUF2895 family protein [Candidatus Thiodiazotropha taylori]
MVLVFWIGRILVPKHLVLQVPPGLRFRRTLSVDKVSVANVYVSIFYVFLQLHRWPNGRAKDYGYLRNRLSDRSPKAVTELTL